MVLSVTVNPASSKERFVIDIVAEPQRFWQIERSFEQFLQLRTQLRKNDENFEYLQSHHLQSHYKELEKFLQTIISYYDNEFWNILPLVNFLDNTTTRSKMAEVQLSHLTMEVETLTKRSEDLEASQQEIYSQYCDISHKFDILLSYLKTDQQHKTKLEGLFPSKIAIQSHVPMNSNTENTSAISSSRQQELLAVEHRLSVISIVTTDSAVSGNESSFAAPRPSEGEYEVERVEDDDDLIQQVRSVALSGDFSGIADSSISEFSEPVRRRSDLNGSVSISDTANSSPDRRKPSFATIPTSDDANILTGGMVSPGGNPDNNTLSSPISTLPKSIYFSKELLQYGTSSDKKLTTLMTNVLTHVAPTPTQLQHRQSLLAFLRKHIRLALGVNCFEIGISMNQTILPDDGMKIMVVVNKTIVGSWYTILYDYLMAYAEKLTMYGGTAYLPSHILEEDENGLDSYFTSDYYTNTVISSMHNNTIFGHTKATVLPSSTSSTPVFNHYIQNIIHVKQNLHHSLQLIMDYNNLCIDIIANQRNELCMMLFIEEISFAIDSQYEQDYQQQQQQQQKGQLTSPGTVSSSSLTSPTGYGMGFNTPMSSSTYLQAVVGNNNNNNNPVTTSNTTFLNPSTDDYETSNNNKMMIDTSFNSSIPPGEYTTATASSQPPTIPQVTYVPALFKSSYLLLRSWWQYESTHMIGCSIKHYLNDIQLFMMLLSIFNQYYAYIHSPVDALMFFFNEYSQYEGNHQVMSVYGMLNFQSRASNSPMLTPEYFERKDTWLAMGGSPSMSVSTSGKETMNAAANKGVGQQLVEKFWQYFNVSYLYEQYEQSVVTNAANGGGGGGSSSKKRSVSTEDPFATNATIAAANAAAGTTGSEDPTASASNPAMTAAAATRKPSHSWLNQPPLVEPGNPVNFTNISPYLHLFSAEQIQQHLTQLQEQNLYTFERLSYNLLHPLTYQNMVVEKLSQRRISRLTRVFQLGAMQLGGLLKKWSQLQHMKGGLFFPKEEEGVHSSTIPKEELCQEDDFYDAFLQSFQHILNSPHPWHTTASSHSPLNTASTASTMHQSPMPPKYFASTFTLSHVQSVTGHMIPLHYLLYADVHSVAVLSSALFYSDLMLEAIVTEPALLNLTMEILAMKGPLPVGEIGKILAEYTSIPNLSVRLKEKFGGLKKFLEHYEQWFYIVNDHPFNPNVILKGSLSTDQLDGLEKGLISYMTILKAKKAANNNAKKKKSHSIPSTNPVMNHTMHPMNNMSSMSSMNSMNTMNNPHFHQQGGPMSNTQNMSNASTTSGGGGLSSHHMNTTSTNNAMMHHNNSNNNMSPHHMQHHSNGGNGNGGNNNPNHSIGQHMMSNGNGGSSGGGNMMMNPPTGNEYYPPSSMSTAATSNTAYRASGMMNNNNNSINNVNNPSSIPHQRHSFNAFASSSSSAAATANTANTTSMNMNSSNTSTAAAGLLSSFSGSGNNLGNIVPNRHRSISHNSMKTMSTNNNNNNNATASGYDMMYGGGTSTNMNNTNGGGGGYYSIHDTNTTPTNMNTLSIKNVTANQQQQQLLQQQQQQQQLQQQQQSASSSNQYSNYFLNQLRENSYELGNTNTNTINANSGSLHTTFPHIQFPEPLNSNAFPFNPTSSAVGGGVVGGAVGGNHSNHHLSALFLSNTSPTAMNPGGNNTNANTASSTSSMLLDGNSMIGLSLESSTNTPRDTSSVSSSTILPSHHLPHHTTGMSLISSLFPSLTSSGNTSSVVLPVPPPPGISSTSSSTNNLDYSNDELLHSIGHYSKLHF